MNMILLIYIIYLKLHLCFLKWIAILLTLLVLCTVLATSCVDVETEGYNK